MTKSFFALFLLLVAGLYGQSSTNFNQRDDQYRMLGLKRAKAAFEMADADYKRLQKLYEDGFVSDVDLIVLHAAVVFLDFVA